MKLIQDLLESRTLFPAPMAKLKKVKEMFEGHKFSDSSGHLEPKAIDVILEALASKLTFGELKELKEELDERLL